MNVDSQISLFPAEASNNDASNPDHVEANARLFRDNFLEVFSARFLLSLLSCLFFAAEKTRIRGESCATEPEFQRQHIGWSQRIYLNDLIYSDAGSFSDEVGRSIQPLPFGNWYAQISNPRFELIELFGHDPSKPPGRAQYRERKAENNRRLMSTPEAVGSLPGFALLRHGERKGHFPTYAHITFPLPAQLCVPDASIDLFEMFQAEVEVIQETVESYAIPAHTSEELREILIRQAEAVDIILDNGSEIEEEVIEDGFIPRLRRQIDIEDEGA